MSVEDMIALAVAAQVRVVVREEVRAALAELGPQASNPTNLLSVEEVAERCHATPKTVRAWIRSGQLKARKAGRRHLVLAADVDRFLAPNQKTGAATIEDQVVRLLDGVRR